jgi:hypothetical protein
MSDRIDELRLTLIYMKAGSAHPSMSQITKAGLIGLTLITSAIHFADNAFRLDLYPGPPWLTSKLVLIAWLILPVAAFFAYRVDTRSAFVAYGLLGFGGLAHYLMPQARSMPTRCTITIGAEAAASALLIAYALVRPGAFGYDSSSRK